MENENESMRKVLSEKYYNRKMKEYRVCEVIFAAIAICSNFAGIAELIKDPTLYALIVLISTSIFFLFSSRIDSLKENYALYKLYREK